MLVDHDPGHQAAGDYSRAASGSRRVWRQLEEVAWRRYAHRTARQIDAVVVFNDRDRRSVESYAGSTPIVVIPFHVSLPEQALSSAGEPARILFFGGYQHPPNADAAERLARRILPCVRHRHAAVELELVGDSTEQVDALAGEAVRVTGHVEAVEPHLAGAAVVAIPIRLGGGMRVKVLESLAAGKAVSRPAGPWRGSTSRPAATSCSQRPTRSSALRSRRSSGTKNGGSSSAKRRAGGQSPTSSPVAGSRRTRRSTSAARGRPIAAEWQRGARSRTE